MAVSKVYNGTTWQAGVMKSWNGSSWIAKPSYYDGTSFVELYNTLAVTASNVSGNGSGFASCGSVSTSGTSPVTTVTGGSGSYTYSWTQIGTPASAGPFNINSSTVKNPTWNDTRCDSHLNNDETWEVVVTDTATSDTASTSIVVTLDWTNLN